VRRFCSAFESLTQEMESYVTEIRMRVDAATPIPLKQQRVFEEFSMPLEHGQQTAIGKGRFFALEYAQPQGAAAHWRFYVREDEATIVGPYPLKCRPVYRGEELVAVIKRISEETVTLSVPTFEAGPE